MPIYVCLRDGGTNLATVEVHKSKHLAPVVHLGAHLFELPAKDL